MSPVALLSSLRRRVSLAALGALATSVLGVLALPEVRAVLDLPLVQRLIPPALAPTLIAVGVALQAVTSRLHKAPPAAPAPGPAADTDGAAVQRIMVAVRDAAEGAR